MPLPTCPGEAHGAAPNVRSTLNTFFPDGRGKIIPDNVHPKLEKAEIAPLAEMLRVKLSPVKLLADHAPLTAPKFAGLA